MKAPKSITTVTSSNAHIANEKKHLVSSLHYDKIQKIKINLKLFKRIEKVADKRNMVLADIARSALEFYLNNPNAPFDAELSKENTRMFTYTINELIDMKVEKFKTDYSINRSNQIRHALSAWLIHENEM